MIFQEHLKKLDSALSHYSMNTYIYYTDKLAYIEKHTPNLNKLYQEANSKINKSLLQKINTLTNPIIKENMTKIYHNIAYVFNSKRCVMINKFITDYKYITNEGRQSKVPQDFLENYKNDVEKVFKPFRHTVSNLFNKVPTTLNKYIESRSNVAKKIKNTNF